MAENQEQAFQEQLPRVCTAIRSFAQAQDAMQKNDMQINTTRIKNYLIRGARRDPERIYPNREWGYGQVDLYETFLGIR